MINWATIKADHIIDAQGLLCPIPVLKLAKMAVNVADGTVIELRATDPMSPLDSEHFCRQKGYEFLGKMAKKIENIEVFSMKIRVKKAKN